ncbi:MAG: tetratricopeptide repeat protein [Patescibacteria group bacterium]|jgi:tetratricopeptide (TPR) repeat protein
MANVIERPALKEHNFLKSVILLILKLEVFFIPLFFLPFTFEVFEFSKQNLLWFFTILAAALWLVKMIIIDKKITYRRTPLDLPIIIFLIFWGISSILSVDWFSSLFGYYGRFSDAYLSTLCFALFYFLAVHFIDKSQIHKIFNVFISSVFVVFIISISSLFGFLMKLPSSVGFFSIMRSNFFNPLGASVESLSLFSAVILILVTALYSYNIKGTRKMSVLNIKYYALFALSLIILLLINFPAAWMVSIIGLAAIFSFALYIIYINREDRESVIEIAVAPALGLFLFSILFLFIFSGGNGLNLYKIIFNENLPQEVILASTDTKNIIWQSFKDNIFFGSGPGTFAYDFSAHRPSSFNNSQFWQLRFDKVPMHIIELFATVGLLGALSYLTVVGAFLFISFVFLKNMFRTKSEESYLAFAFSFAALSLFIVQILYITNLTLSFLFWFLLALAMVNWRFAYEKIFIIKEIDLSRYKDVRSIYLTFFFVFLGFIAYFFALQARHYLADVAYNNFRLSGNRESLITATKFNPRRVNYRIALSRDYLQEIQGDIQSLSSVNFNVNISGDKKQKLQNNIQLAIKEGEAAIAIAPNSVIAWENIAVIYRDVRSIAVGSMEPSIRYFEKAHELEPSNPVILTELGKLYLINSQTKEAVDVFDQAIKEKENYLEAHIGLAKTYDQLGQTDKALIILEEVISVQPNAEVIYESGRLYYNQGKIDKAIERFSQAVQMRPGYANAMYSLGLAYKEKGDKINALEQFEKVLEMNPGNQAVSDIIEGLKIN